ncbi:hypothetical protein BGZ83_004799 [Gryganskiella cystojenkinii]|nr:hypothetical protein BGZ83_004799 [Gryganskiella cystojenkinii]
MATAIRPAFQYRFTITPIVMAQLVNRTAQDTQIINLLNSPSTTNDSYLENLTLIEETSRKFADCVPIALVLCGVYYENHNYFEARRILQMPSVTTYAGYSPADVNNLREVAAYVDCTCNWQLQNSNAIYNRLKGERAPSLKSLDKYSYRDGHSDVRARAIKERWNRLITGADAGRVSAAIARIISIDTNEVEDVFKLDTRSNTRALIVRGGYYNSAVQHAPDSSVVSSHQIFSILEDAQNCLNMMLARMCTPKFQLDGELICAMHVQNMDHNKTVNEVQSGVSIRRLLTRGRRRYTNVYVGQSSGIPFVFHHVNAVAESMGTFVHWFNMAMEHKLYIRDPYGVAMWVHHMLIHVHPFEDGNGRITRLIASIPLMLAGYPPARARFSTKAGYIDALRVANATCDLKPLLRYFQQEAEDLMDELQTTLDEGVTVMGGIDAGSRGCFSLQGPAIEQRVYKTDDFMTEQWLLCKRIR